MYIIYQNDIFQLKCKGKILSFADDTVILYEGETWEDILDTISTDAVKPFNWFTENKLTVNYTKTYCLTFGCYTDSVPQWRNITIHMGNCDGKNCASCKTIERTSSVKYLGITIDQHLRWSEHVDNLVRRLRYLTYAFKRLKAVLDIPTLKIIYTAIFLSNWRYGIIGWGGATKTVLKPLETLQKRVIKIIFNKGRMHPTAQLFVESKFLDVRQEYCSAVLKFYIKNRMYKIQTGTRNLRSNAEVKAIMPKRKTTTGRRCYDYAAPKYINSMSRQLRIKIHDCDNSAYKDAIDSYVKLAGREAAELN